MDLDQESGLTVKGTPTPSELDPAGDAGPPIEDDVASIAYWERAAELSPSNFGAFTQLGHLHLKAGDLEEARSAYRRAQGLKPGHAPSLVGLAEVAQRLGDPQEALEGLLPLLARRPDIADAALLASTLLVDSDRVEEAGAVLARAIARRGNHVGLLAAQARLLQSLDNRAAVLSCWTRILELQPHSFRVMSHVGRLLAEQRKYADAEPILRQALEVKPRHRGTMLALAKVLQALGRNEEALAMCDAALALEGEAAPVHMLRAAILIALDRPDEASDGLHAVRQSTQENRQILKLMARCEECGGLWEVALGHWQSILSGDPGNQEAADHVRLCRALIDNERMGQDPQRQPTGDGARARKGFFGLSRSAT
jgi:tetratricopeptide (TPR) repeat protein